ncbi:MAG: leucyl aminopeptidase [Corynebacterium sp.]|nr:leucyl aminopeptidase [Corynebacterium sp.]
MSENLDQSANNVQMSSVPEVLVRAGVTNVGKTTERVRAVFAHQVTQRGAELVLPLNPRALGKETEDVVNLAVVAGFEGKRGETSTAPQPTGETYVVVGLGEVGRDLDDEAWRRIGGNLGRAYRTKCMHIDCEGLPGAFFEGYLLGAYEFHGLRREHKEAGKLVLIAPDEEVVARVQAVADSVNLVRDIVNTPPNILYPESYAQRIVSLFEDSGLPVTAEVLDFEALQEQGFGGVVAVGKGSERKPRVVILRYKPEGAEKNIGLVGKGITFDTGGISLKPGAGMDDMTSDMAGSATMVGVVYGAARLGLKVNLEAVLPLAENMPSGTATKPGDVIRHYGGVTSEILNTDAEGRLVLADALARASEGKPDYLIDVATLTGAQMVALGTRTFAVMGHEKTRERIARLGINNGEPAVPFPFPEEIIKDVESDIADIRNITKARWGGMQAAGIYLSHFAGVTRWAHLDIAGPAYNTGGPHNYTPKRATGNPVRTLIAFLEAVEKE